MLQAKHKNLLYKSCHRGTREMDFVLGTFAQAYVHKFSGQELEIFSKVLHESDADLYQWIIMSDLAPFEIQSMIKEIKSFIGTNNAYRNY